MTSRVSTRVHRPKLMDFHRPCLKCRATISRTVQPQYTRQLSYLLRIHNNKMSTTQSSFFDTPTAPESRYLPHAANR